jgi:hypothetical protein
LLPFIALGAPPPQQDRYLAGAYFRIFLGLAGGNGRAIELEADLGFRHD